MVKLSVGLEIAGEDDERDVPLAGEVPGERQADGGVRRESGRSGRRHDDERLQVVPGLDERWVELAIDVEPRQSMPALRRARRGTGVRRRDGDDLFRRQMPGCDGVRDELLLACGLCPEQQRRVVPDGAEGGGPQDRLIRGARGFHDTRWGVDPQLRRLDRGLHAGRPADAVKSAATGLPITESTKRPTPITSTSSATANDVTFLMLVRLRSRCSSKVLAACSSSNSRVFRNLSAHQRTRWTTAPASQSRRPDARASGACACRVPRRIRRLPAPGRMDGSGGNPAPTNAPASGARPSGCSGGYEARQFTAGRQRSIGEPHWPRTLAPASVSAPRRRRRP